MENFIKCPSCKKDVAVNNFVIHSARCERNITNCRICSEPIPRSELEEHELSHEHVDADKLLECQFCDLELPVHLFDDHVTACGARTEKCTICDQYVMYKDKGKHKNNCGKERMSSITKSFICRYCRKELPYDNIHEHDRACGSKTQKCPKCDSLIKQKEFLKHISICAMTQSTISGQCDICGLTVKWVDMDLHKLICRYEIAPYDEQNNIERNSESVTPPPKSENLHIYSSCKFCGKRIPDICLSEHEEKCQRQKQDFSSHNKKRYPKRNKDFHGSNGDSLEAEKDKTSFTSNRTLMTDEHFYTLCPYCTRKIVDAGFDQHLEACSQNLKTCKFCNRDVPKEEIDAHLEKCFAELHGTRGESHERKSDGAHNKSSNNKANKPPFSMKKAMGNFLPQRRKDKRQEKEEIQQPITESFSGEVLIPCEFCDKSFPMFLIIEHQSGCRPDLLHYSSKERPNLPESDDNQQGAYGQQSWEHEYSDDIVYEAQNQVNLKNEQSHQVREKHHQDSCPPERKGRNEKTAPSRKHFNLEYESEGYDKSNSKSAVVDNDVIPLRTETFRLDCSQQTRLRKQHETSVSHIKKQGLDKCHKEQHWMNSQALEEKCKKVPFFKFGKKKSSDEEVEEKNTNWDYEEVPRDRPLKHPKTSLTSTNLGTKFSSSEKKSGSSDSLEEIYYSLSEDEGESIVKKPSKLPASFASNNSDPIPNSRIQEQDTYRASSAEDKDSNLNAYMNFLEGEDCLDTLQLSNNKMNRNCKCNSNICSCQTLNSCIPEVSSTGASYTGACAKSLSSSEKDRKENSSARIMNNKKNSTSSDEEYTYEKFIEECNRKKYARKNVLSQTLNKNMNNPVYNTDSD